jgi:beta-lactamase regulating signal transducer with metallopeptidase domain
MIPIDSPFRGLIATSLFTAFIIALFLPLRPLLRRAIDSQWLCVLWLALLVRLLLPWPLETRWGLMDHWQTQTNADTNSAQPWKIKITFPAKSTLSDSQSHGPAARGSIQLPATSRPLEIPLIIWLCGFVASMALLGWRWFGTNRLAAETSPATDERLVAIFSSIPAKWRRNVELRMTALLNVPTLARISHPQIWLPQSWLAQLSDEELRGILLHELGHARRGDLAVQCLFAFAQCLHWFNPFVWLATRAARFDREMACDAWVLTRDASPAYGDTLLKTARLLCKPGTPISRLASTPSTVTMASSRQNLRARIAGIGAFRPARVWPGLLGIAFMIVALALLTTSRTIGQTPAPAPAAKQAAVNPIPQPLPSASAITGTRVLPSFILIRSKFVEIDEPTWRELCAENPAFQRIGAESRFPELKQPPKSYATIQAELNDLRSGAWELKKGAWETSTPFAFIFHLSDQEMQKMLAALNRPDGVDLLGAPTVTTRPSQHTVIEMVREYRYPSTYERDKKSPTGWSPTEFAMKNLGVTLGLSPYLCDDGGITFNLSPEVSSFLGFLREKNGIKTIGRLTGNGAFWRPIFSTSNGEIKVDDTQPHQTLLMGAVRIDDQSNVLDFPKLVAQPNDSKGEPGKQLVRHIVLVFVTPEIVGPNGDPLPKTPR